MILDINSNNSFFFTDYVRPIYRYLVEQEYVNRISPHFLDDKPGILKMRAHLTDWLIDAHSKLVLLQETMYLCVYITDTYLDRQHVPKKYSIEQDVLINYLELVGLTALLLASISRF